ncbi:DUF6291 domain-containing protein [Candidatus Enterovibrio escicola]|uniref:DUF6291 domain-containing protein n=1 Tax=Candidatus Enterovibrio escicola TaxID=1927127 RepID=UPI001237C749|nr:DUF6291 domain-containing protein [Candidatus Enterovibrio escacola]
MSNKKSFVMYIDSLDILDKLSDEQAGKLIKAIACYHKKVEVELDPVIDIVITPFISQFKRDAEKYEKTCKNRALAGAKGGKQKVANASKSKQKLANLADSDSDSDSDSDINNKTLTQSKIAEKETIPVKEIVEAYNEICTNMPEAKTISQKQKRIIWLKARWREQDETDQNLDWWRGYFKWCNEHPQLTGQQEGFSWIASLEDLVNASKFQRLIEKGSL